jgi:uncharacterized protein
VTRFFDQRGVAVLRYLWFGRPFWAIPTRVVEDRPERTVLWVAPGTRYRRQRAKLTMAEIAANDWMPVERPWDGSGTLMLSCPGDRYSTWLFWDELGVHRSWYFNLELPWRRTALGFDSRDHQLDVIVLPDGTWRWKDEDDLRDAAHVGLLSANEARQIRHDGERIVASLDELLPTGLEDWRPEPSWSLPTLPPSWARDPERA